MAAKLDEIQRVDALKQTVEEVCVELASLGEESLFMSINLKQRSCFYLGSEPGKEFLTKRMDIIENFYHYINTNYPLGMMETSSVQGSPHKAVMQEAAVNTVENEFTYTEKPEEEESLNIDAEYQDPEYVPVTKSIERKRRPRTYRTSYYTGDIETPKPQVILDMERMIMKKKSETAEGEGEQMSDADSERSESKIEKIVTSDIEYVKSLKNKQKTLLICADCGVVCSWKRSMLTHLVQCKKRSKDDNVKTEIRSYQDQDSTEMAEDASANDTNVTKKDGNTEEVEQSEGKEQRTEIVIQLVAEDGQQVARLQKATVGEDGEITLTVLPDDQDTDTVDGAMNPLEQAVKIITESGEVNEGEQLTTDVDQVQSLEMEASADSGLVSHTAQSNANLSEGQGVSVSLPSDTMPLSSSVHASSTGETAMSELSQVHETSVTETPVIAAGLTNVVEAAETQLEQSSTIVSEGAEAEGQVDQDAVCDKNVVETTSGEVLQINSSESSQTTNDIDNDKESKGTHELADKSKGSEETAKDLTEATTKQSDDNEAVSMQTNEDKASDVQTGESGGAPVQTDESEAVPMQTDESEAVPMQTDESPTVSSTNEKVRDDNDLENEGEMTEDKAGNESEETKIEKKKVEEVVRKRGRPPKGGRKSQAKEEENEDDREESEIMTALTLKSTKKKENDKDQGKKGKKTETVETPITTSRSKRQVKASKRYEDFISTPIKIKTEIKTEPKPDEHENGSSTPRSTRSKASSVQSAKDSKNLDTDDKKTTKKRKADVMETPKTRSKMSLEDDAEEAEVASPASKRMRGDKSAAASQTPKKSKDVQEEEGEAEEEEEEKEIETPVVRKRGRPPKKSKKVIEIKKENSPEEGNDDDMVEEDEGEKDEGEKDEGEKEEDENMEEDEEEDTIIEDVDSDEWSQENEGKKPKSRKSTPKSGRKSKRVRKNKKELDENRYRITVHDINEAVSQGEEKGKYVCKECGLVCNWKRSFMRHLEKHRLDNEGIAGSYQCPECQKEFVSEWEMKNHLRGKHKMLNVFKCDTCTMSFHTGVQYKLHKKKCTVDNPFVPESVTEEKPYICNYCLFKFKTEEQLNSHKELHSIMEYRCDECGKVFPESYRLKNHKRDAHDKSAEYHCDSCEKIFTSARYLHRHRVCVHKKSDSVCRSCGKLFPSKEELRLHIKLEHEVNDSLVCPLCKEKFTDFKELEAHRPVHYAFQCETCGKKFQKLVKLREHLVTHTGDYKYYCEICKKGFLHKSNLEQHLTSHSEKRLHTCETCGASFKNATVLKNHFKVHSDSIDFPCKFCETAYRTSEGLKCHMIENHMTEEQIRACNMEVYKCEFCNKFMGRKQHYERHRNQHLGVKKYKCTECPLAFYSQYHLNRHLRSHSCDLSVRRRIRRPCLKSSASATKSSATEMQEEEEEMEEVEEVEEEEEIQEQEIRTDEETVYISTNPDEQGQEQTISYTIPQGDGEDQLMAFVVINVPQENGADVAESVTNIATVTAAEEDDVVQSILNLQDGIING